MERFIICLKKRSLIGKEEKTITECLEISVMRTPDIKQYAQSKRVNQRQIDLRS